MSDQKFIHKTPERVSEKKASETTPNCRPLNETPMAPKKPRSEKKWGSPLEGPKSLKNEFKDVAVSESTLKYWAAIAIVIIITIILSM
jgi:hypothetical protein